MKILAGVVLALILVSGVSMSQSTLTTRERNGLWYLALGGTDRLIYVMGYIDGSNINTTDFPVEDIKASLDEFYADKKNASSVMVADALPIVIQRLKTETR